MQGTSDSNPELLDARCVVTSLPVTRCTGSLPSTVSVSSRMTCSPTCSRQVVAVRRSLRM
jgi:hypothetical protein